MHEKWKIKREEYVSNHNNNYSRGAYTYAWIALKVDSG